MLRALSLTILFALAQSFRLPAEEPTLQEQYLRIYLQINEADQLDQKGDFCHSYPLLSDALRQLIILHNSGANFEQAVFKARLQDCDAKLHELKANICKQPLLPSKNYQEFIGKLTVDFQNWEKLQGPSSELASKLIVNRISDDKSILAYLKQP